MWPRCPDDLSFGNTHTRPEAFQELLTEVGNDIGVASNIHAELHNDNLLVYAEGGHFADHTDTQKLEGQYVSPVKMLPAAHVGGLLVVHHDGQSLAFPLDSSDAVAALAHPIWAAYDSDCELQVTPVSLAHRLVLVYNLVRRSTDAAGETGEAAHGSVGAPDQGPALAALSALALRWASTRGTAAAAGTVDPP